MIIKQISSTEYSYPNLIKQDEACWFLSLKFFGLLSSSLLLFPQPFGGHIGRNVVEITIKMKTIVRKTLMIKKTYKANLNIIDNRSSKECSASCANISSFSVILNSVHISVCLNCRWNVMELYPKHRFECDWQDEYKPQIVEVGQFSFS